MLPGRSDGEPSSGHVVPTAALREAASSWANVITALIATFPMQYVMFLKYEAQTALFKDPVSTAQ